MKGQYAMKAWSCKPFNFSIACLHTNNTKWSIIVASWKLGISSIYNVGLYSQLLLGQIWLRPNEIALT